MVCNGFTLIPHIPHCVVHTNRWQYVATLAERHTSTVTVALFWGLQHPMHTNMMNDVWPSIVELFQVTVSNVTLSVSRKVSLLTHHQFIGSGKAHIPEGGPVKLYSSQFSLTNSCDTEVSGSTLHVKRFSLSCISPQGQFLLLSIWSYNTACWLVRFDWSGTMKWWTSPWGHARAWELFRLNSQGEQWFMITVWYFAMFFFFYLVSESKFFF